MGEMALIYLFFSIKSGHNIFDRYGFIPTRYEFIPTRYGFIPIWMHIYIILHISINNHSIEKIKIVPSSVNHAWIL